MSIEKDTERMYAEVLDEVEDNIEAIENEYDKTSKELEAFLFSIAVLYKYKDEAIPYWKINTKKLEQSLFRLFSRLADFEAKTIRNVLNTVAVESYARNTYVLEKALKADLKFKSIPKSIRDRILDFPYKGLKFSERLGINHTTLITNTKSVIVEGLTSGKSIDTMTMDLNTKLRVGKDNAKRLVRTESSRVWHTAQEDAWTDAGVVEQVIFIATLDNKTSQICQEKDGKIYDLNKDHPIPPLHPNCRSTLGAYFGELPKYRKDNITKEVIPFTTYADWKKKRLP